jgi:hypothetical protein
MGEVWAQMLLNDETKQWLQSEGVPIPEAVVASRWPTSNELRGVLDSLQGYRVVYKNKQDGWDAEVVDAQLGYDGMRATIWVENVPDGDTPTDFTFHKPSVELALMILERLSHACGPVVFVGASSMKPVLVSPGCDVKRLASVLDE